MVFNSKKYCLSIVLIISSVISIKAVDYPPTGIGQPMSPQRNRRDNSQISQQQMQLVQASEQIIQDKLKTILEQINNGQKIPQIEIENCDDLLKENIRYMPKMDENGKAAYFTLSAWTNYFANDYDKAARDALRAYKESETNGDARATFLAISILTGDHKSLLLFKQEKARHLAKIKAEQRKALIEARKSGSRINPKTQTFEDNTFRVNSGTLSLSLDVVLIDLLGEKVDPIKLKNIDDEEFTFPEPNCIESVMAWAIESKIDDNSDNNQNAFVNQQMLMMGQINSSQTDFGKQINDFKALFNKFRNANNTKFLLVNTDKTFDIQKSAETLEKVSDLFGIVILNMQESIDANSLDKLTSNSNIILILNGDGQIAYAGQLDNYLPVMLIEKLSGHPAEEYVEIQEPQEEMQIIPPPAAPEQINPGMMPPPMMPGMPIAPPPQVEQKPVDETTSLTDDIEAQKLYQIAEISRKKGKFISYKKMVDACREIMQKYPNTQYAPMARDMLRQLPPGKRNLYKITDEELGFK